MKMSNFHNQTPSPEKSIHIRRKASTRLKEVKKENKGPIRKVRVIYNDPYATDSESDLGDDVDALVFAAPKMKRVVKEIVLSGIPNNLKSEYPHQYHGNKKPVIRLKKCVEKRRNPRLSTLYPGVRQRQWGNYAAEIRNPNLKKRVWLGTFNTAEEAANAYKKKKTEIQGRLLPETNIKMENCIDTVINHPSNENSIKHIVDGTHNSIKRETNTINVIKDECLASSMCDKLNFGFDDNFTPIDGFDDNFTPIDGFENKPFVDFMQHSLSFPSISEWPEFEDDIEKLIQDFGVLNYGFEYGRDDFSWLDDTLNMPI